MSSISHSLCTLIRRLTIPDISRVRYTALLVWKPCGRCINGRNGLDKSYCRRSIPLVSSLCTQRMWSTGLLGSDPGLDHGVWLDGRGRIACLPSRNHHSRTYSAEQRELRPTELAWHVAYLGLTCYPRILQHICPSSPEYDRDHWRHYAYALLGGLGCRTAHNGQTELQRVCVCGDVQWRPIRRVAESRCFLVRRITDSCFPSLR